MPIVGSGKFTYELINDWGNLPHGEELGRAVGVAVDSEDRVYVIRAKKNPPADPPILVFDRDGNFLSSWGSDAIVEPHGINIVGGIAYMTDKEAHTAVKYTLEGKVLLELGNRGQPSDTGCVEEGGKVLRAGAPFNTPTGMTDSPSGDLYATDGYRNSRVHRFTAQGELISSWGEPGKTAPGQFHCPHCVWVDREGKVYVVDRYNSRVQVFSATGEFLNQWTDMEYPTGLWMDSEETVYICEGSSASSYAQPEKPPENPKVSIWDKQGNLLERMEAPSPPHWIYGDSQGNLYLARPAGRQPIAKYERRR